MKQDFSKELLKSTMKKRMNSILNKNKKSLSRLKSLYAKFTKRNFKKT